MPIEEKSKIIVLEPVTKTVGELLKILEQKEIVEIDRVSSPGEVTQLALQFQPCVVFINLMSPADIASRVNMIKSLESGIKYGQIKILFASNSKNKQIGNLITSLGVTDYMEEPIPLRTLQFKANIQIKAIATIKKNLAAKKTTQEKIVFKKGEQKAQVTAPTGNELKRKSPLGMREDFFLFRQQPPRKVGKKTLLEAEGPDPSTGEWVEHESKGDAKTAWRWVPKDEKEKELLAKGKNDGWIHKGDKPQFSDQSQKWQFASEQPSLSFVKDDEVVAEKVTTDANGEIEIAEDSPEAEENIQKSKTAARVEKAAKKIVAKAEKPSFNHKEEESAEIKTSRRSEPENSGKNSVPLGAKATGLEADEIEFSNRTGGLKDKPHEFNNRIDEGEEEDGVKHDYRAKEVVQAEKTTSSKARQAIGFLKQQKELQKKVAEGALGQGSEVTGEFKSNESSETEESEEDRKESITTDESEDSSGVDAEKPQRLKKKNLSKGIDKLKSMLNSSKSPRSMESIAEEYSTGSDGDIEEQSETIFNETTDQEDELNSVTSGKNLIGKNGAADKEKSESNPRDKLAKSKKGKAKLSAKQLLEKKRLEAAIRKIENMAPELLSEAELIEAKKDLGIDVSEDIAPEELAKRAKLKKLEKLKEKLLDLNETTELGEKKEPARNVHDLAEEEPENTWSQKGYSEDKSSSQRGKRNVIDSELAQEDQSEEKKALKKRRLAEEKERQELKDTNFYLPKEKIVPFDGAWERAGEYCVYLSSEIKYRGFSEVESVLPLWVYAGGGIPALLDKTEEWRFQDCLPEQVANKLDLPSEILDFLISLKERTKNNAIEEMESEEGSPENIDSKQDEEDPVKDLKIASKKSKHLKLVSEEDSEVPEKGKVNKLKSKLDSLKSKLKEQKEETEEKAPESIEADLETTSKSSTEEKSINKKTEMKTEEDFPASSALSKRQALRDKLKKLESTDLPTDNEEVTDDPIAKEAESEIFSKPEKEEKGDLEEEESKVSLEVKEEDSKIAQLKKRLGEIESESIGEDKPENRDNSPGSLDGEVKAEVPAELEDSEKLESKKEAALGNTEPTVEITENTNPKPEPSVGIEERLSKKSPALEKFFAKRKEPKDASKDATVQKVAEKPQESKTHNPYLGVMVAISNSFGVNPNYQKRVRKLLSALNDSFTPIQFFIVESNNENSLTIKFSATGNDEQATWNRNEQTLIFEIPYPSGRVANKLRYLDLKLSDDQKQLDAAGTEIVKQASIALGTILSQESVTEKVTEEAA